MKNYLLVNNFKKRVFRRLFSLEMGEKTEWKLSSRKFDWKSSPPSLLSSSIGFKNRFLRDLFHFQMGVESLLKRHVPAVQKLGCSEQRNGGLPIIAEVVPGYVVLRCPFDLLIVNVFKKCADQAAAVKAQLDGAEISVCRQHIWRVCITYWPLTVACLSQLQYTFGNRYGRGACLIWRKPTQVLVCMEMQYKKASWTGWHSPKGFLCVYCLELE